MLILASASETRAAMLRAAGVAVEVRPARVDEVAVRAALSAEGAAPRDVADALAEMKAVKRGEAGLCLGADQVLEMRGDVLSKAETPAEAAAQIRHLAGRTHELHAAAVLARDGTSVWRAVETATMTMRPLSEDYVADYVARNWDAVRGAVGCYHVEGEGARFFSRIDGSHFAVLGLPLLPLLDQLIRLGEVTA